MPLTKKSSIEEQSFLFLGQCYALCRKIADRELMKHGITVAEYSLLRILQNTPGVTASDVRRKLGVSAPSIAKLVENLERKKLLQRSLDKDDVRRSPMELSTRGRKVIDHARRNIETIIECIKMSPNELSSLHRSLSFLFTSLSSYGISSSSNQ